MGTDMKAEMIMPAQGIYARFIKRPLDFFLALSALIVLCPVLLAVALLVRIKLGSPVIFRQERPGLNERIFTVYKFKTMVDKRDENGELLPDSLRLTPFGRVLRSTSLDELPELFNILCGDMAVIGPRPLLVRYLPYYTEGEKLRHRVRPGLSGLAQVSGRNNLKWDSRFALDVHYVRNISFHGDMKIIMMTLIKAFKREGITAKDEASMKALNVERDNQLTVKEVRVNEDEISTHHDDNSNDRDMHRLGRAAGPVTPGGSHPGES